MGYGVTPRPYPIFSSICWLLSFLVFLLTFGKCRSCASSQQVRKPPAVAPLMHWMWPSNPWHRIHIDYAEDENGHYLIVVDAHSRWPEIFFMPRNTSAGATISILRELFAKYDLPVQCVSDNGSQFRSEDFVRFLKLNGVKHVRVAPYHAASNGLAERMVQSFKTQNEDL